MYRKLIVLIGLLATLGFFIHRIHSSTGYFSYRSELAGDKAGYYVYLPAIFIYDLRGENLPEGIEEKLFRGFRVDSLSGLIHTKYSIGTAILQAPAFLVIHAYQVITGGISDGFSGPYHNVPNLSAWIYASLGLWFMYKYLDRRYNSTQALTTMLLVFFGTHLFYYAVRETGMSHVYSFFLFTALMWQLQHAADKPPGLRRTVLIGIIMGLMILVRPLNLLFIAGALGYYRLYSPRFLINFAGARGFTLVLALLLTLVPQFWYWHSLTGDWLYYSYGDEGFANILNPQFKSLLFAPLNGLFPYAPLYAVLILSSLVWIKSKPSFTFFFLGFFGLLTFVLASWHTPQFGCGFGSRNYVEYLAIFSIPLAELLRVLEKKWRVMLLTVLVMLGLINLKLTYAFETCFWGESMWDWREYKNLLFRGVYSKKSGEVELGPEEEFVKLQSFDNPVLGSMPSYAHAELTAKLELPPASDSTFVVLELWQQDSLCGWWAVNIRDKLSQKPHSHKVHQHIGLPEDYPRDSHFKVLVWNKGRDTLKVDYLRVWLR